MVQFTAVRLLRNREFAALAGTAFARSQAYSTVLIALALYADLFNTTGTVEGLFGTAFAAVQLVIVLPLGRKVDTGNARRYLLAGFAVNVTVFLCFIFVSSPEGVVLVRVLQGLGASMLWITGSAVVGEISPDNQQGLWLGSYNQFGSISSLAGDLIGGYLLYAHGFTATYLVLSGITLCAFVLVAAWLRDNPGGQTDPTETTGTETIRALLGLPMLRSLVLFRLTFSVGKMAVIIFIPIYARTGFGVSAFAIGWIMAGGKLTKALTQGVFGTLTDRWGHRHYFVAGGALLYAAGTAAIPLAAVAEGAITPVEPRWLPGSQELGGAFFTLFAAYSLLGIADSVRLPASMSLFVDEGARYDSVASAISLRSVSWKVGQTTGPVVIGSTMDIVSTEAGFLLAAGLILFSTAGFVITSRQAWASPQPAQPAPGD